MATSQAAWPDVTEITARIGLDVVTIYRPAPPLALPRYVLHGISPDGLALSVRDSGTVWSTYRLRRDEIALIGGAPADYCAECHNLLGYHNAACPKHRISAQAALRASAALVPTTSVPVTGVVRAVSVGPVSISLDTPAKPKRTCECGVWATGGLHSEWCPDAS